MWGQAYMITIVEDAYEKGRLAARKQLVSDLLNTFIANEITPATTKDLSWDSWNDDVQWAVIALIRGYQITGNTAYRDAAVKNWNMVYNRGWDSTYGGGIWENMADIPNGGKNSLSNYPQIISGCLIYQATGDTTILSKCQAIYAWARSHLFNTTTGRLYENWNPNGQNTNSDDNVYNSGIFVNSANALYRITGNVSYYNDAILAANHIVNMWPILTQDKPANGDFGADQFVRALALLAADNNLWNTYWQYLQNQCVSSWNNRRTDYNITWNNWASPTTTGNVRAMNCMGAVTVQAVTPDANPGSLPNNGTYKIISRHSGKALEVSNYLTANGSNVQQWGYVGIASQKWTLTRISGNLYKIIGVGSGRSLDVSGGLSADGTNIQIWDYVGANQQIWSIWATTGGYYKILALHSGKAADVDGVSTADGANIHQWTYVGGNNQQWQFLTP